MVKITGKMLGFAPKSFGEYCFVCLQCLHDFSIALPYFIFISIRSKTGKLIELISLQSIQ